MKRNSDSVGLENKRRRFDNFHCSSLPEKKHRAPVFSSACLWIKAFGIPLISATEGSACETIFLDSYITYVIGRSRCRSDFIFDDRRVSKRHCQFYFDASNSRICLLDGAFRNGICGSAEGRVSLNGVYVNGIRIGNGEVLELRAGDEVSLVCGNEGACSSGIRVGFVVERIVFVEEVVSRNLPKLRVKELALYRGVKSRCDSVEARASFFSSCCKRVLSCDDPILCIRESVLSFGEVGASYARRSCHNYKSCLVAENAVELVDGDVRGTNHEVEGLLPIDFVASGRNLNSKRVHSEQSSLSKDFHRGTLEVSDKNADPTCCDSNGSVENCIANNNPKALSLACVSNQKVSQCGKTGNNVFKLVDSDSISIDHCPLVCGGRSLPGDFKVIEKSLESESPQSGQLTSADKSSREIVVVPKHTSDPIHCDYYIAEKDTANKAFSLDHMLEKNVSPCDKDVKDNNSGLGVLPPEKGFYLNRLQSVDSNSSEHCDVSLPELFYPIESLVRVFIATFTCDISWFLSHCNIPAYLPVTIACHNAEKCWSSGSDNRTSVPFSDFPNLLLVYPPFPEIISFDNTHKKFGIACHHPKLLVLQRHDSIRVVITSANLVSGQWQRVSNTVWWQDFPRAGAPDYLSLFSLSSNEAGDVNQDSKADFAAHLAGFIASLLTDVPNQAHWILELVKYDFSGAVGHLVASVPGIYSQPIPHIFESKHCLTANLCRPYSSRDVLGSVVSSVVGISHLFRMSADSNGQRLKKLAVFLGKCHENAYGMLEIVLRRNKSIPADSNAISLLVPNPENSFEGDSIQVGFLPRDVAVWVAPLVDTGFFAFSAYIYPKEVLPAALEGCNNKAQLILYVSQGPSFPGLSQVSDPVYVSAICSLVGSIQRYSGLWRLQEVLCRYKWPERLETDFIFGSSSIGAVNAPFLAAFAAAAGKRSLHFSESDESDPDWGCWSASQELRNPSIKVLFPTIDRVKNASCGILASKRILCFSEKTWQRLRNFGILHDAVPCYSDRIGYPMHVKVARRRFQSKAGAPAFGWVYSGSHNFSAAAWGRPIFNSFGTLGNDALRTNSVLGSRLHISNYEIGIIFVVPPSSHSIQNGSNLDDIVLPFVVPAPKYRYSDRPATAYAMREALAELAEEEYKMEVETAEVLIEDEIPDEVWGETGHIGEEKEDERSYAEMLWGQSSFIQEPGN